MFYWQQRVHDVGVGGCRIVLVAAAGVVAVLAVVLLVVLWDSANTLAVVLAAVGGAAAVGVAIGIPLLADEDGKPFPQAGSAETSRMQQQYARRQLSQNQISRVKRVGPHERAPRSGGSPGPGDPDG